MGLTGGIADCTSLYDCLMAIQDGLADDSILDKYNEVRRRIWHDHIDPMSRSNFNLIWDETKTAEREAFFAMCRETDSAEGSRKKWQDVLSPQYQYSEAASANHLIVLCHS